jgi:putative ABC transport system permease protein
MARYLPLIFKNGLRNRRRSVLTVLSVALSLCLLGLLMAIYHAFYFGEETPQQALRLVTRNRISLATVMPVAYRQKIQQVPGVREVMVSQWFGGVYKEPKNFFARFAVEPDKVFTIYPEYNIPEDQKKAFQRERTACVMHKAIAQKFNLNLGDKLVLTGDIFPGRYEFVIRGFYDGSDAEAMYFNIDYLYEMLGARRKDFAGTFLVLGDTPQNISHIAKGIDEAFRNSTVQTLTETERGFQLGFLAMLGNVKVFLLSVCGAVTFTILLVTANTMAMSARERVKEVGVLKTLGFTNGSILGMILGEAAVLSLIGGFLGCLLASVLAFAVRQAPGFLIQLKTLTLVPSVAAGVIVLGVVIGIFSSFIPAWNASRTPILESLRFGG